MAYDRFASPDLYHSQSVAHLAPWMLRYDSWLAVLSLLGVSSASMLGCSTQFPSQSQKPAPEVVSEPEATSKPEAAAASPESVPGEGEGFSQENPVPDMPVVSARSMADQRALTLLADARVRAPSWSSLSILKRYQFMTQAGATQALENLRETCVRVHESPEVSSPDSQRALKAAFWNLLDSENKGFRSESDTLEFKIAASKLIGDLSDPTCQGSVLHADARLALVMLGVENALKESRDEASLMAVIENARGAAAEAERNLTGIGWSLSDIPALRTRVAHLRAFLTQAPFASSAVSARVRLKVLGEVWAETDPTVKEASASALAIQLLGQGAPPVRTNASHGGHAPLIKPGTWNMDASITYGACGTIKQDFSGQKVSSFELARKCTYAEAGAPSRAEIRWVSASTSSNGANYARFSTNISSYVQGGYRPPTFLLGIGSEDFVSKVKYKVTGSFVIPACSNLANCEPVLKIRADFNEINAGKVEIRVESQALSGVVALHSHGAPIEVDRSRYPIRITTLLSRSKSHRGACCEPGVQDQQLNIVVSPADGSSLVPREAAVNPKQYLEVLAKWMQYRLEQPGAADAKVASRELARWIALAPVSTDTRFEEFLVILQSARLLVTPESVQSLGLDPNELYLLQAGVEILEKRLAETVLPHMLGEGNQLGQELAALRPQVLDSLLEQWADSEEVPIDSWRTYISIKNSSALKSDASLSAQLDEVMNSLLDARDRRILLLADLMEFRELSRTLEKQSLDSKTARLLWAEAK